MTLRECLSCYFTSAVSIGWSGMLFVLLFTTTSVYATSDTPVPIPIVWEKSFGDEQYSYESKAAMVAPGGMLTVAGTYQPVKNRHAQAEGGWIWKIDGSGKKISDVRINSSILGSTLVGIDSIEFAGDDVIAVVGNLKNGKSFLIKIDGFGQLVQTIDLSNRRIAKIIRMRDSSLLLAGQKNNDMLLMKLDKSGAIIWEMLTERGRDDSIIDGNVSGDRLLIVEMTGKQEQFAITDSMIGLVTPTLDGKIDAPVFTAKGRYGSLASDSKRIGMIYDASMSNEQDIRLVIFNSKLNVVRNTAIAKGKIPVERFRLGLFGKSDFIAVSMLGGKMTFTLIAKDGKIKSQHTRINNDAFFLNPEVVGSDSNYVVSTMMVLTSEKTPKTLVNILKLDSSLPVGAGSH